jgi:hypothetical protein
MTPHQYMIGVLGKHQTAGSLVAAQGVIDTLSSSINEWAGDYLYELTPSGSIAKGTAISGPSDVDVLVSLDHTLGMSLKDIYESLFRRMTAEGYAPRRQNVSLGLGVNGWKVDLVPGRRQSSLTDDHSIWSHKMQSHRETNIHEHVRLVANSGRINEIKLVKVWRKLHGLEFPSYLLEVVTIDALHGNSSSDIASNFSRILVYIRDILPRFRIIDPTKPSNVLSDELTVVEKQRLSSAASRSLSEPYWEQVIW